MILDAKLVICDETDITGAVSNAVTGDVLDLGTGGTNAFGAAQTPNIGEGGGVFFNLCCAGADFANAGGTSDITFSLVTATDSALTTSATVLAQKTSVDQTPNDGDMIWRVSVPGGLVLRYLGLVVNVADVNLSSGKISAWIGQQAETPLAPTNLKK